MDKDHVTLGDLTLGELRALLEERVQGAAVAKVTGVALGELRGRIVALEKRNDEYVRRLDGLVESHSAMFNSDAERINELDNQLRGFRVDVAALNRAVFPEPKPAGLESGQVLRYRGDVHPEALAERARIAQLISDAAGLAGEVPDTGNGIHPSWPLNVVAGHIREGTTDPADLWAAWKPWARP